MANLGRPAFIRDEVKPGRMLAARVIHLGDQHGGSGLGSRIPTARAARGHWVKGDAHAEGERGDKNECGVYLTAQGCCNDGWRPRIEGSGVELRWRKAGWRRSCPRVVRRSGSARAQRGVGEGKGG
jgi:hypothetical protein